MTCEVCFPYGIGRISYVKAAALADRPAQKIIDACNNTNARFNNNSGASNTSSAASNNSSAPFNNRSTPSNKSYATSNNSSGPFNKRSMNIYIYMYI